MNKLFLIALTFLFSCNLTKQIDIVNTAPIITLQRTACYGTCPIYKIEIYSDGSGIYTGTRFVDSIGVSKFKISKAKVRKILSEAERINFANMKDEFYEPVTDLPTTYIRVKDKKIKDYLGAPKKLKEFERLIDSLYLETVSKGN